MSRFIRVALPVPMRDTFTYLLEDTTAKAQPGMRVRVTFGRRELIGIIDGTDDHCDIDPAKSKRLMPYWTATPLFHLS